MLCRLNVCLSLNYYQAQYHGRKLLPQLTELCMAVLWIYYFMYAVYHYMAGNKNATLINMTAFILPSAGISGNIGQLDLFDNDDRNPRVR